MNRWEFVLREGYFLFVSVARVLLKLLHWMIRFNVLNKLETHLDKINVLYSNLCDGSVLFMEY